MSVVGMVSFVKEYVAHRKIPIPELLCAFDLLLVGAFPAEVLV
jgi:hypothetical protein